MANATRDMDMVASADVEMEYVLPPEAAVIRQMVKDLRHYIDPEIIIPSLHCLTKIDEEEIKAKNRAQGPTRANQILLEKIVKRDNFWNDLLQALRDERAVGLGHMADKLEKALVEYNENQKASQKALEKRLEGETVDNKYVTPENSAAATPENSAQTEQSLNGALKPKLVFDEETNSVMPWQKSQEVITKHIDMIEKSPRQYQNVLAMPAMQGENTIMCAPTGCGKTLAASLVCKAHLEKGIPVTRAVKESPTGETEASEMKLEILKEASIPNPKILFLVPRNAILEHVYKELTGYLVLWKVGSRRGNSSRKIPLHKMFKSHDVIVATADIFKNALLTKETNGMKISDPTLIIIDECHHTTLDHSYNKIMYEYLKIKHGKTGASLPQIVGLSASPGAGKTPSESGAFLWILKLCANLDAKVFQTVPEELQEELGRHVPTPKKSMHSTGTRLDDPFSDKLIHAMEQIEGFIALKRCAEKPGSPEYQSLVTLIKQEAEEILNDSTRRIADHLLRYNEALLLVNVARFKDGFNLLKDFYEKLKERQTTDTDEKNLLSIFKAMEDDLQEICTREDEFPNPKLTELRKILLSHKQECGKKEQEFRAIVFVKTKSLAKVLKQWMESDGQLVELSPEVFTGVRADEKGGGMTEAQQNLVLSEFASGAIQVLISTSVGEEGVDIQACNIVIRYDDVKNEISMVQSRGRARAMEAHEAVIGETQTIEKHQYNVLMEDMMNIGINRVQTLSEERFVQEIGHLQSVAMADRRQKELRRSLVQNSNEASSIELKCKGLCGQVVCRASDIRVFRNTHYVNPDPEFREKVTLKDHTKEDYKKKGIQKVHCKACGHDWGNTVATHPTLALKSFLVITNGQGKSIKQWSKIPCTIAPLQKNLE